MTVTKGQHLTETELQDLALELYGSTQVGSLAYSRLTKYFKHGTHRWAEGPPIEQTNVWGVGARFDLQSLVNHFGEAGFDLFGKVEGTGPRTVDLLKRYLGFDDD